MDPAENFHYRWLSVISAAVLYNVLVIVGRSVFWELQNAMPIAWYVFDYTCDGIYLLDMVFHGRTGAPASYLVSSSESSSVTSPY